MITISAYRWVPDFAQGLVKDLRVRWALEEAGLSYETRLIGPEDQGSAAYRALQPFGQVPTLEEDGLKLFESGAIVLHIAGRSEALMPADAAGRARTAVWVLAALNSLEPAVDQLGDTHRDAGEDWAKQRRAPCEAQMRKRLGELQTWLGDKAFLEGRFTAGDLMMTTVLRNLRQTTLLDEFPALVAYKARGEARPAFQRALAAHMAPFQAHEAALVSA
jgi:glutathione S-transferase